SNSALFILCPVFNNSDFEETSFQLSAPLPSAPLRERAETWSLSGAEASIFFSFSEENGRKGSLKIANAEAICNATYITVLVRSSSVLIVFHGSSSAKYLLPRRATFI